MRGIRPAAFAVLLTAAMAGAAHAQSAEVLLHEGISAYDDVDFVSAAHLLRRALEPDLHPALNDAARARALAYLGAAQYFRKDISASDEAFRQLVLLDPRYRLSSYDFAPRVRAAFAEVLRTTKTTAIASPGDVTIVAGSNAIGWTVYVSSSHLVRVVLSDSARGFSRTLFEGTVADSTTVTWDGTDSTGHPAPGGAYSLDAISLAAPTVPLRTLRIPLAVTASSPDTLVVPPNAPPDSLFRSERTGWGTGLAFLIPGAILGAVLIDPTSNHGAGRVGLGVAALGAGVAGFVVHRPNRPIPGNVAYDDSLRAAWRTRAEAARNSNDRRRRITRLTIRSGAPARIEQHR